MLRWNDAKPRDARICPERLYRLLPVPDSKAPRRHSTILCAPTHILVLCLGELDGRMQILWIADFLNSLMPNKTYGRLAYVSISRCRACNRLQYGLSRIKFEAHCSSHVELYGARTLLTGEVLAPISLYAANAL